MQINRRNFCLSALATPILSFIPAGLLKKPEEKRRVFKWVTEVDAFKFYNPFIWQSYCNCVKDRNLIFHGAWHEKWQECKFKDLKKDDCFFLVESNGELTFNDLAKATCDPYVNGKLTITADFGDSECPLELRKFFGTLKMPDCVKV